MQDEPSQRIDLPEQRRVVIWTTTPWTLPGNRAIAFSPKIDYGLYEVTDAPTDNWAKVGDLLILADKLAAEVFKQARVTRLRTLGDVRCRRSGSMRSARIRCKGNRAMISRCRCSPAIMSPTTPAPASCTPRPAMAARTSTSGRRNARALEARGINTAIPYTVDDDGAFTDAGAGLHRQARHHRQGREGRRQRGGDQGADRRRHADRARAAEAPVSAFLALEEAGDLPQHAAMVHRHGQAIDRPGSGRHAARIARSRAIKADPLGAGRRARTASPA